jgi:hypothetical protein
MPYTLCFFDAFHGRLLAVIGENIATVTKSSNAVSD